MRECTKANQGMIDRALRMMAVAASASVFAAILGCSAVTPSTETPAEKAATAQFDLSKCEVLEPSLYRCPGVDKPLCDPDFMRSSVECVKVTKNGVLLQVMPSGTM